MKTEIRKNVEVKAMFKNMETEKNEEFKTTFDVAVQQAENLDDVLMLINSLSGESLENFITWLNTTIVKKAEETTGRQLIDKQRGGEEKPLPSTLQDYFASYSFTRSSAKADLAKAQAELASLNPANFAGVEAFMAEFARLQASIATLTEKAAAHAAKLGEARKASKAKPKA